MEFEAQSEDLVRAVNRASLVVERKVENLLLTNVKIEAYATGSVKIVGSSLIMTAGCRLNAKVAAEGATAVDQQRFLSILSNLPTGKKVKLKLLESGLQLKCGQSKYELLAANAHEFPNTPKPGKTGTVEASAQLMLDLIRSTESGMLNDDQRAHLSGALFEYDKTKAYMVTTDARRLVKREVKFETKSTDSIFIPYRAVIALRKFCETLAAGSDVSLQATGSYLFFWNDVAGFSCRLIETKRMDYAKAIPPKGQATFNVKRGLLIDALTRLKVISEDPVRMFADKEAGKLEITSSNSSAGAGREMLKAGFVASSKDCEVVLSVSHLLEFLNVVQGDTVTLKLNGKKAPTVVKPVKDADLLAVFLPLVDNG
jgi:DNA polymerase-3 subunit beta